MLASGALTIKDFIMISSFSTNLIMNNTEREENYMLWIFGPNLH